MAKPRHSSGPIQHRGSAFGRGRSVAAHATGRKRRPAVFSAMAHARMMPAASIAVVSFLLMALTPPFVEPNGYLLPAKLGFSYLSKAQVEQLWRLADNYAMAEAFLKQCGAPSWVERRMMLAARDCVEQRALNRVAAYFRAKLARYSGEQKFVCDTEPAKALVKTIRVKIDAAVEEVRSMCRACLFC